MDWPLAFFRYKYVSQSQSALHRLDNHTFKPSKRYTEYYTKLVNFSRGLTNKTSRIHKTSCDNMYFPQQNVPGTK